MNTIVLLGRTTSDIELKQTQAGKSVATFSLAVKRPFTKDVTDFFNITVWDKQAELVSKYVGKGDQICIRGYLQNRTWEDSNGNKRYATDVIAQEITFCESKKDSESNSHYENQNGSQSKFGASPYVPQAYTQPSFDNIKDDDLPF